MAHKTLTTTATKDDDYEWSCHNSKRKKFALK